VPSSVTRPVTRKYWGWTKTPPVWYNQVGGLLKTEKRLLLRDANDSDLPLLLAWRNNPLIWEGTYTQRDPLLWEDHVTWWKKKLSNHRSFMVLFVNETEIRPVGVLHISPLDYWSPEIGIIIGEVSLWDTGVGTEAFRLGCEWLKEQGYKWTSTTVLKSNKRAIRMLEKLNFKYTCEARKGELRYAKAL